MRWMRATWCPNEGTLIFTGFLCDPCSCLPMLLVSGNNRRKGSASGSQIPCLALGRRRLPGDAGDPGAGGRSDDDDGTRSGGGDDDGSKGSVREVPAGGVDTGAGGTAASDTAIPGI